jgi:CMP-N,N'-diacetyllegionaminic acid synthase
MFKDKKVLAIITARGGSKGVPGKNVRDFCGKPLIAWTIQAAQRVPMIDRLILSSEDSEIIEVAQKWGCEVPFVRPDELATDEAHTSDCLIHALEQCPGYDWLVLLQPTSPLRAIGDIEKCIDLSISQDRSCVSVVPADPSPCHMFKVEEGGYEPLMGWENFLKRRQDLPEYVGTNGAVYGCSVDSFIKYKTFYQQGMTCFEMPAERSVDIDTEADWQLAEFLYKRNLAMESNR